MVEMTLAIVALPGLKPLLRSGPKSQSSEEATEVTHHHDFK